MQGHTLLVWEYFDEAFLVDMVGILLSGFGEYLGNQAH